MSDGSVIIDTLIDTKGFGKGVSNMQTQFAKIGGAVKKVGFAIASAFSVQQIVNFAKEAIELGSDLQEVQNVVDVTFGEMSSQIDAFAKNAIKQFGLSELAAKQYTSTLGAILKSSGFSTAQSLEMSKTLAGLTGDIASFYNLSSEDAFNKIRAGITGETEPLKQLGINLSEANLEAYALSQGLSKTYAAMSQQEKMLLRYNYILHVTADAQGDFARTSSGWANQTRILSEQFNSLKATIGQGLINALTPVLQVINTIISGLQAMANAFRQFTALLFGDAGGGKAAENAENMAGSYDDAADSAEQMAAATGAAGKAAKKYLTGLDELNTYTSNSGGGGGGGGGGALGSDLLADLDLSGGLIDTSEITEKISSFAKELVDAIKAGDWKSVGAMFSEKINGAIGSIDTEKLGNDLSNVITSIFDTGTGFFDGLDGKEISKKIYKFFKGIKWGDIIRSIIEFIGSVVDLGEEIIAGIFEPMVDDLEEWFEDTFTENGELTAESFLEGLRITFSGMSSWFDKNIIKPFDKEFGRLIVLAGVAGNRTSGGLLNSLSDLPGKAGRIFADLRDRLTNEAGQLDISLSDIWAVIKKGAVTGLSDIPSKIAGIFNQIADLLRAPINNVIRFINTLLFKITYGINQMIYKVNSAIPSGLRSSLGLSIPLVNLYQIPYLAKGAVIPPNAPFTAVLGDQRNGRNLEAPESLIRQIIREEMGGGNGGDYRFVAQINRRTLFDETIAEAKLRQSTTGKNPFDLA